MRFDGDKLKALREATFPSRRKAVLELAKKTGIEVTETAWANWERKTSVPGSDMLPGLAALFDVEMSDFFSVDLGREDTKVDSNAA